MFGRLHGISANLPFGLATAFLQNLQDAIRPSFPFYSILANLNKGGCREDALRCGHPEVFVRKISDVRARESEVCVFAGSSLQVPE